MKFIGQKLAMKEVKLGKNQIMENPKVFWFSPG